MCQCRCSHVKDFLSLGSEGWQSLPRELRDWIPRNSWSDVLLVTSNSKLP
ncbi:rCG26957 [Rattus norvegicus]|uniref:RCG26957 n=1 Tax=Rattus norvegicus TaxID=10116 RepID=A6HP82_RAT|nr:rCG26957 [Rattus norvegicus]